MMNKFTNIFDSHLHTQSMLEKGVDCLSLYQDLFNNDFVGAIDIGCTHNDIPERYELLKDYPKILLSAAMGPWEAGSSEVKEIAIDIENAKLKTISEIEAELKILKDNIIKYNPRFIGEIGLDYYWEYGSHEKQHLIFETQMMCADKLGKMVLIHDRDADDDTIDVIKNLSPSKSGVIHCFDGSENLLKCALDYNYYISFAGNLTFKKNSFLRDILKKVPLDRLLLETDAPYLTPVPHRGKFNRPSFIIHTFECAAKVLNMPLEELSQKLTENFITLCNR